MVLPLNTIITTVPWYHATTQRSVRIDPLRSDKCVFKRARVVVLVAGGSWLMTTNVLQSIPVSHAIPHADNITRRNTLGGARQRGLFCNELSSEDETKNGLCRDSTTEEHTTTPLLFFVKHQNSKNGSGEH